MIERRKLMPKKFRNYVIKGQKHVDRKQEKQFLHLVYGVQ